MRDKKEIKKPYKKDYKKEEPLVQKNCEEIDSSLSGKKILVSGRVERIVQTGGPTIFEINDGTGNLALKAFLVAGERAYPNIVEGDVVVAVVKISEFNGELEGDIVKISEKKGDDAQFILKKIEKILREKAKVNFNSFMINTKILDKLKDKMIHAAEEIRFAILENRPIIVRHHNDADGYASGFALEKAIIPLIEKMHQSQKAAWEYYVRAPSSAPYYEIDDSIRDTASSLRNVAKFSNKMPLIIIADNGSTKQDLIAIQQAKIHGAEIIVVDHHPFEEDLISKEVLEHVNPYLVGERGDMFSAGMLCSELALMINPEIENIEPIPAMSGLSDRIDIENKTDVDKYCELATKKGYSKKLLNQIALVIEYSSVKLKFMEAREYIEVLFGEPREQQKKLVELMAPYIEELDKQGLLIAKSHRKIEKIGKKTLQIVDIDATFPGFGFYPKPGRAVGLVHDDLKECGETALVSAGVMATAITFRATDSANFSVQDFIKYVRNSDPETFIDGGGHKNAGSVTFLPYKKDKVVEMLRDFMKN